MHAQIAVTPGPLPRFGILHPVMQRPPRCGKCRQTLIVDPAAVGGMRCNCSGSRTSGPAGQEFCWHPTAEDREGVFFRKKYVYATEDEAAAMITELGWRAVTYPCTNPGADHFHITHKPPTRKRKKRKNMPSRDRNLRYRARSRARSVRDVLQKAGIPRPELDLDPGRGLWIEPVNPMACVLHLSAAEPDAELLEKACDAVTVRGYRVDVSPDPGMIISVLGAIRRPGTPNH